MILWLSKNNHTIFLATQLKSEYERRLEAVSFTNLWHPDVLYVLAYNQERLEGKELATDVSFNDAYKAFFKFKLDNKDSDLLTFTSFLNSFSTLRGVTLDLNILATNDKSVAKIDRATRIAPVNGVVNLPPHVNMVEQDAYRGVTSLLELNCSSNLWLLGASAFRDTVNLSKVRFGKSLMQISNYCFFNSGIEELVCPASLRSIDNYALANCRKLRNVELNEGLLLIDAYAFNSCSGIVELKIPSTVEALYTGAFSQCYGLMSVSPLHVKRIESGVFYGCRALQEIEFTSDVEHIDNFVLQECNNLKTVILSSAISDISRDAFLGVPKETKFIVKMDTEDSLVPLRLYQAGIAYETGGK